MSGVIEDLRRFYEELWHKAYRTATQQVHKDRGRQRRTSLHQVSPSLLVLIELQRDLRFLLETYARRDLGLEDEAWESLEQWRAELPQKLREMRRR
jgi:hypothetical protein